MPLAYAGQFYVLREHIGFVRERLLAVREKLEASQEPQESPGPQEPLEPKPDAGATDAESPR
jgi:hypothetical protein